MEIEKVLYEIEKLLEQYEDTNEPEDKLDLKQTIKGKLKEIRNHYKKEGVPTEVTQSINDIEEILSY